MRVILAHIMNPGRVGAADFDLIALPRHDCERPGGDAPNVLRMTGAPHRVTPARLAQARERWTQSFADVARPLIAVLVGGTTHQRLFPTAAAHALGTQVSTMARTVGGTVLLTTSRRTGPEAEAALLDTIAAPRRVFRWGQDGENPYVGWLALADAIVVTGDSVSMICEACATSASVFIYAPPGLVAPKHRRLHDDLYARGFARPFDGAWATQAHPPLNSAQEIAARLSQLLALK
jgi:mitochondrial fission protein ELM1